MQTNSATGFSQLNQHKKISEQLSKIFNEPIKVSSEPMVGHLCNIFYIVLHKDKSIKLAFPCRNNAHLLNYLSPIRQFSKLILILLKVFYKLNIFRFLPNVQVAFLTGFNNINWGKYGWKGKTVPNIFLVMGTLKNSQNAVVFLDSKDNPNERLDVKTCINESCNLGNEYSIGKSIEFNATRYVAFNNEERFLTQKYDDGFRKISNLTDFHVDFLSRLLINSNKKSGTLVKADLKELVQQSSKYYDEYNFSTIDVLANSIKENMSFYRANVHGDFAPYNIIYKNYPEKFTLIDWERSSLDGLALIDLFNYVYIRDCLFVNKGREKIEPFIQSMARKYFLNIGHNLTLAEFYEYKTVFVISEFIERLSDAGPKDIYVKYLYEIIESEY